MLFTRFAVATLFGIATKLVFAWGPDGHKTVGKIADSILVGTPAAAQVKKLIGMSLAQASVWADCAKGVSPNDAGKFRYKEYKMYPECAPFENPASAKAMEAFVARNWKQCKSESGAEVCHKKFHYTNVAVQRNIYATGLTGTSDTDLVGSMRAVIAVLKGEKPPSGFSIVSKREALLLLAHYIGDLHQPLHVSSVYLDSQGALVDPDQGIYDPSTFTRGGNSIIASAGNLHGEWDSVPAALGPDQLGISGAAEALAVTESSGHPITWPSLWATDTISSGAAAFEGASFSDKDSEGRWTISTPPNYRDSRQALQRTQLIKGGARLAQLLKAIWP
jgi:S1/P1 Nuclease